MKAVMAEFLIRWPCPAAVDEDHHLSRMLLLFSDCRDLAPSMMRKAGDTVARTPHRPTVMPSASEIIGAVETIMADRAAKQNAMMRDEAVQRGQPMPTNDRAAAYHRANVACMAKGMKVMQTDDGELYKLGDKGERRGIRPDGSAIVPFFRHDGQVEGVPAGWYVRQEDVAALARCYSEYGAGYELRGAKIVERVA
jgi:hypothetical protein